MKKLSVLLDSCVLFPMYLRDTLLCVAEAGLYFPYWSQEVIDGAIRNLINTGRITREKATKLEVMIKKAFPWALVEVSSELIEEMTNHPGDRHVLAAAVTANANIIVTSNLKHFKQKDLAPWNIEARSPDQFLCDLYKSYPEEIIQIIQRQSQILNRPPMTVVELLDLLGKKDGGNLLNFSNNIKTRLTIS